MLLSFVRFVFVCLSICLSVCLLVGWFLFRVLLVCTWFNHFDLKKEHVSFAHCSFYFYPFGLKKEENLGMSSAIAGAQKIIMSEKELVYTNTFICIKYT